MSSILIADIHNAPELWAASSGPLSFLTFLSGDLAKKTIPVLVVHPGNKQSRCLACTLRIQTEWVSNLHPLLIDVSLQTNWLTFLSLLSSIVKVGMVMVPASLRLPLKDPVRAGERAKVDDARLAPPLKSCSSHACAEGKGHTREPPHQGIPGTGVFRVTKKTLNL